MAVRLKDRIEANIRQSDKVNSSLSIQLNSGTATVYDGSAGKSINITPAAINALALSGGTMTGAINFTGELPLTWNDGTYFQRIAITDDSDVGTPVFQFQQSTNSGSSWNNLFTIRDNGTVLATLFSGSGASLTTLNASNVSSGVLSMAYGGTGQNLSSIPAGAIIRNSLDGTGFWYSPLQAGAFYTTGTTTAPVFGTLPVAQGGTGQTTARNAANAFLVSLETGSSAPVDADYIITQYVGGGTSNRTYIQRPVSALWNYIKTKTDNFYLSLSGGTLTGNLNLVTGDSDRFITFRYNTAATAQGASWRIGCLGSGSGDANYLVFQTTTSTTGSSETWSNALRLGMNTKQAYFYGQVIIGIDSDSAAATANTGSLIIGSPTGAHISIDGNEIMAKASGTTTSTLYLNNEGGKIQCGSGGLYGAVWNDYAEFRDQNEPLTAGYIAYCDDDGKLKYTTERLQKFEGVVSDTFGFAIGETDECKTPLAVSGRALVYCDPEDHFHSGDCVCAGPDGKAYRMTREEIAMYPDRIVGVVSEIPTYERWGSGDVEVNGRIWIKVK